ncbi:DUF1345 domain-containing protein [Microbacterium sp. zg.Y625]|uniref:DUF1345 domain-containing protein n=1 Tax=Microbacterium jiangjiandongii TaxID=3049071 RepID=UPI00214B9AA3|nr:MULTISPECIES: DUF1345 domain-containing protein [unclassified Microbacterium]MCR2791444.1 DUF1345 domain-containing protein [Microbacterium sp. zg.Y625]WIM24280.1 DUF1345 domain-containing protein [Microbacterium sp. zg-Y625]
MQAARYVSDTARANWSSLLSAIVGVALALGVAAVKGDLGRIDPLTVGVEIYLFAWPSFGAIYLVWTHAAYSGDGVAARARRERELQRRWWWSLIGYGGASSWTLTAALGAVVVTVLVAQTPAYRGEVLYVTLGLLCVACSWALMVYSFALQYLRLQAGADDGEHIGFEVPGPPRFGDYLNLTILLSTMAATVSAAIRTREAWAVVRTNVLFAFTFNSVIVAMVVSLLLGGLAG